MTTLDLKDVHAGKAPAEPFKLQGWIRSHRQSKQVSFIELYDGTSIRTLQLVVEPTLASYTALAARLTTGSAIEAIGVVVDSPAKGQKYEFRVSDINLIGEADVEKYPLQKK